MKAITKQSAATIRQDALKALQSVARKHGLSLTPSGGTYDPEAGVFIQKLEWSVPLRSLSVPNPNTHALRWGLAPRGSRALLNNREVIISKARRSKYTFVFADEAETEEQLDFYTIPFQHLTTLLPPDKDTAVDPATGKLLKTKAPKGGK